MSSDFSGCLVGLAARSRLDLHAELKEAMRQVAEFGGFTVLADALGITPIAMVECGGLGVLRVVTKGRQFVVATDDDNSAPMAVIVPVWEPALGGDLVDLLAFRLDRPASFLVRIGYAKCLGTSFADQVRGRTPLWALPGDIHPTLELFPNPLAWLLAGCQGTVILNEAWLQYSLCNIRSVLVNTKHHAEALHGRLTWPGAPKIYIRQRREAA